MLREVMEDDQHGPQIQIQDMGGHSMLNNNHAVALNTNGSRAMSAVGSDSQFRVVKGGGTGDHSRLGAHTRTTEHTSHVGMNNTTDNNTFHGGMDRGTGGALSMSFHAPGPDSVSPTVANTENILNYPYAYDQDQKHEVDFQERLYRANNEV